MFSTLRRIAFVLSFAPISAAADDGPTSIWDDYAADGWRAVASATGDLNRDGLDDAVVVIEAPGGITEPANACTAEDDYSDAPVRRLIVAFVEADGRFTRAADEPRVALRADEGGAFGDPFEGVFIEHGSVVIMSYGGSRWRWALTLRFRFDDGDWRMTGMTDAHIDSVYNSIVTYDYNALTGKVQVGVEESPVEDGAAEEPLCVACRAGEQCPKADGCNDGTKRAAAGTTWFDVGRKERVRMSEYRCWDAETGLLVHTGFQSRR
jgi:hypothetical protein